MKRLSLSLEKSIDHLTEGSLIEHRYLLKGNGIKEKKVKLGTVISFNDTNRYGKGFPTIKWHSSGDTNVAPTLIDLLTLLGDEFFLIQP